MPPSPFYVDLCSQVLQRLETFATDEYVIAFGPDQKQFVGTPNGYLATYLPSEPFAELANGIIKKVLWVSFGSAPESWFFSFECKNGEIAVRLGAAAPKAVREYVDTMSTSRQLLAKLRVQLGHGNSFVAWSSTVWACSNDIPGGLHHRLRLLSSHTRDNVGTTLGSFTNETLSNVHWHKDGSYYLKTAKGGQCWDFKSTSMRDAWHSLWQGLGDGILKPEYLAQVAYVAMDSHATTSDTFVMIKTKGPGNEAPFILRVGQEPMHINTPAADQHLQRLASREGSTHFQWALSLKTGRPHQKAAELDVWELKLEKDQKVKVWKDLGKDWFLVEGKSMEMGYVHSSWLKMTDGRLHQDPKSAWTQFNDAVQKILMGNVSEFPPMRDYVDACTTEGCRVVKADRSSLGICVHDLKVLLEASGCYSLEWVKDGRNMWHPDRFARYCVPEHAGRLQVMAEQMFVLYTMLMDTL